MEEVLVPILNDGFLQPLLASISLSLILATSLCLLQFYKSSQLPTINRKRIFEFSSQRVRRNFTLNARQLLLDGLQEYGGKPFRILTSTGPLIILPPNYAQEIRNIPDLDHSKAVAKIAHATYPGLESFYEFAHRDDLLQDVVRIKLTQALNSVTESLSQETALTLHDHFTENQEWHTISTHSTVLHAVARVSSRLFLGDRLCRDPEWLDITTTYTHHVTAIILELNSWPSFLRPLICRFLPRTRIALQQLSKARVLLGKILAERQALQAAGEAPSYVDAIEWFKQMSRGRDYDPVNVQMMLSFTAIHTTADMITQLLFDLALHPEYIPPLREEIISVLGQEGWKKTSLYRMKLLDSVMKESQRLRPINETSMQRLATSTVKLSDGTIIPRNTQLSIPSTLRLDEAYYPDPLKFDGYRFLRLRSSPGKENVAQFVSTSADHLGFGHGKHACPGRFFASNEIKIIMCHLLMKYEWRLVEGQMPKTGRSGFHLFADHETGLDIRRRRAEIDIDNL